MNLMTQTTPQRLPDLYACPVCSAMLPANEQNGAIYVLIHKAGDPKYNTKRKHKSLICAGSKAIIATDRRQGRVNA